MPRPFTSFRATRRAAVSAKRCDTRSGGADACLNSEGAGESLRPHARSALRVNSDPSLLLRMTDKE
jgi:hypothetical protein